MYGRRRSVAVISPVRNRTAAERHSLQRPLNSDRLKAYFVGEARDYLDQIDQLLAGEEIPDSEQLLRLATAVRGSMDMAGADRVSQLAGCLEDAARSLTAAELSWSGELREVARQTALDLRRLAAVVDNWGREHEEHVKMSISRWTGVKLDAEGSPQVLPIETLYYDDAGPHVVFDGASASAAREVVSIEHLLLRGEAALRGALELRPAFEALARGERGPRSAPELVDELFDLLDLSLTAEVQEA